MKHEPIDQLRNAMKQSLAARGFRARGMTFWRNTGTLCQTINLQKSVFGPTVYVHFAFQLEDLGRVNAYAQAEVQVRLESFEEAIAKELDQALEHQDALRVLEVWKDLLEPVIDDVVDRTQTRPGLANWLVTVRGAMITRRGHDLLDGFMLWGGFLGDLKQSLDHHDLTCQIDEDSLIIQRESIVVAVYGDRRGRVLVMGFEHQGRVTDHDVSERVCSGDYVSYESLPNRRYQALFLEDRLESVRKTREAILELLTALE